jgi:glycosyltransferase involved in cell wall biosynthesis
MDESPEPRERVGVVIRTLNEEELLGTCLRKLAEQRSPFDLDVVVVDSGSTDATLEIARAWGVTVVEMEPSAFDYSSALNLGIRRAEGDLVLILSAHAVPLDERWVAHMTAPFEDPRVAGVTGRQVPWPTAPFHEVARLQATFPARRAEYRHDRAEEILFSNAASCIRRAVWSEEPFARPAAEDLHWARRVTAKGWTIVYEPAAVVRHSHAESPRAQARRLIDLNRRPDGPVTRIARLRAVVDAGRYLRRYAIGIAGLDEPPRRKAVLLGDVVRMAGYYVRDFGQAGTTAERRRARP